MPAASLGTIVKTPEMENMTKNFIMKAAHPISRVLSNAPIIGGVTKTFCTPELVASVMTLATLTNFDKIINAGVNVATFPFRLITGKVKQKQEKPLLEKVKILEKRLDVLESASAPKVEKPVKKDVAKKPAKPVTRSSDKMKV